MTAALSPAKFRKVGVSLNGKHIRAVNAFAKARGIRAFSTAVQVIIHEHAQMTEQHSPAPTAAPAVPEPAAPPAPAPASPIAEVPAGSPVDGEQVQLSA